MRATVEDLPTVVDSRGLLVEPLGEAAFAAQRNAHLVVAAPGMPRGNHVHAAGTEVITVVGPALARLEDGGERRDVRVPAGRAARFTLPPGVAHAFRGDGPGPLVLVAFNTEPHDRTRAGTTPVALLGPAGPGA